MQSKITNVLLTIKNTLWKYRVALITASPVVFVILLISYLAYFMPETRIEHMIYAPKNCDSDTPVYVGFVHYFCQDGALNPLSN